METQREGNYVIPECKIGGEYFTNLYLHYKTFGNPKYDKFGKTTNAILILHGTGQSSDLFMTKDFAGVLFSAGGTLDANHHYIIIPDMIGAGRSSKPSDGLRSEFPHYGYRDMVWATHELLTIGLKVNHLKLVWGGSMGGMLTWLWGETYPQMMDGLMPMACLPVAITGRNYVWREMCANAILRDPGYYNGFYRVQPVSLREASDIMWLMAFSAPVYDQQRMPTVGASEVFFEKTLANPAQPKDANDFLYQVQASYDYRPQHDLDKIQVPSFSLNTADDAINPPELGVLEKVIPKVLNGQYLILPISAGTRSHISYVYPILWEKYLRKFLQSLT